MANGLKETKRNDKWKAESDRKKRERDEGKMDAMLCFLKHRKQSMLGSALRAWSVLIQKRSNLIKKDKAHIWMDPLSPGQLYIKGKD